MIILKIIIKNIQKYDQRIKIINNNRNMGALYSRSIAALMSKGEYIFSLDNDDMYFEYDVLDYIYERGKKENLDIIGFLTVNIYNYTAKIKKMKNIYTYMYPEEFYLEQPELSTWMVKFKGKFLVHNIFQFAKNFKYVHKYGILHYKSNSTASFRQSKDIRIFGEIFFLDIIYDFSSNNPDNKNLIVGQAVYIHNRYNINKFNNNHNSFYLKSVLNKIIKSKYLSKLSLRKIKKLFSSFLN